MVICTGHYFVFSIGTPVISSYFVWSAVRQPWSASWWRYSVLMSWQVRWSMPAHWINRRLVWPRRNLCSESPRRRWKRLIKKMGCREVRQPILSVRARTFSASASLIFFCFFILLTVASLFLVGGSSWAGWTYPGYRCPIRFLIAGSHGWRLRQRCDHEWSCCFPVAGIFPG